MKFKGKVAVITGGSGILGGVMAKALAKEGCKIAILGSRQAKVTKMVEEISELGAEVYGYACNILDKEALIKGRDLIRENLGLCDILINAAGGNHPRGTTSSQFYSEEDQLDAEKISFFDLETSGVEFVFGINFMGTFIASQVFGEDIIKTKGNIINISSMSAFTPLTQIPSYSASKAATSNFTQWLAVHFAKLNVRVNALAPGFFITEQNQKLMIDDDGNYTARAQKVINHTPSERFGKPEELIGAVLFLADNELASFVNGVILPIDGGFSAYSI